MAKLTFNVVLVLVLVALATETVSVANAQNCSPAGGGKKCPTGICCSQFGWCGTSPLHCKNSNTSPSPKSFDAVDPTDYVDVVDHDRSGSRATRIVHQTIVDQPQTDGRNFSSSVDGAAYYIDEDDSSYSKPHCGRQGKGTCDEGYCCSFYGYCGTSDAYCGK